MQLLYEMAIWRNPPRQENKEIYTLLYYGRPPFVPVVGFYDVTARSKKQLAKLMIDIIDNCQGMVKPKRISDMVVEAAKEKWMWMAQSQ